MKIYKVYASDGWDNFTHGYYRDLAKALLAMDEIHKELFTEWLEDCTEFSDMEFGKPIAEWNGLDSVIHSNYDNYYIEEIEVE